MGVGFNFSSVVKASIFSDFVLHYGRLEGFFVLVLLSEPVLLGSSGVRKPRQGTTHKRALQAPQEMTYICTGRAQGLIFHRVPLGQSKGPIKGAPYTTMVQWFHR